MSFFNSLILNLIILLVPILIYIVLNIYVLNKKYDKYYFLVMIFLIYLFLFIYSDISFISLSIFVFIPLLLSYLSKNKNIAIVISLFLIFINYYFFSINIYLLILEYILYFIIYIKLSKNNNGLVINTLIIVRTFFLSFYLFSNYLDNDFNTNIIYLIISIIISYFVSYSFYYVTSNSITLKEVNYLKKKNNREDYSANYLSAVLREVKDSLTISSGYLDMIDIKNKKYSNYLKKVKNEVNHSIEMIRDGDNLNTSEYKYEIIDVNVLIEEVVEEIKYIYDSKKIKYSVKYLDDDIFILGDFDKLKEAIVSLLKRKDKGIKVNIDIYLSNNRVVISIKDNSKVKKEDIKKIDLMSIKKIINNHRGDIIYENIYDEGIDISIILPLMK